MKLRANIKKNEIVGEVASRIIKLVQEKPKAVLGVATGNTMLPIYEEVVRLSKEKNIDWSGIRTFNLDEYVGVDSISRISYRYYMEKNLFSHINIGMTNTFFPTAHNYKTYEKLIDSEGGIDLQLLGVGTNGHIAFNEPGSAIDSITRIIRLTESTIESNIKLLKKGEVMPTKAYTMGIQTILKARSIICIAFGTPKLDAILELKKGAISGLFPITYLLKHDNADVLTDNGIY